MNTSNVDVAELSKFSDSAHRWWDPHSEYRPLHLLNPLRLDWIDSLAGLKDRCVVDIGCGGGLLAEGMAKRGTVSVLGVDLSVAALKVAQLHAMESNMAQQQLSYRAVPAEALALECPGAFDVVTCMEMLEHVPDPHSVVAACASLVATEGWVFFSTISRTAKAFAVAIVGAEYLLKMLTPGTHEYARFLRPRELATMARDVGLEPVRLAGVSYHPLTQRFTLTSDCEVNYMLACRKC